MPHFAKMDPPREMPGAALKVRSPPCPEACVDCCAEMDHDAPALAVVLGWEKATEVAMLSTAKPTASVERVIDSVLRVPCFRT